MQTAEKHLSENKSKNITDNITENDYAHWLFSTPGIGNVSADRLLCGGRTCREIYEMGEAELKKLLRPKQVSAVLDSRYTWDFAEEKKKLAQSDIKFISRIDPRFPEKLKNIPNPPFAIYVKGELPGDDSPSVAVIGARLCSEYGRYMARQLGRGLALAGVKVISGMARGIDGVSQKAALCAGGKSYAVVGCGADICYPDENREIYEELSLNGGIISEYAPGTMPKASFFPMRNRIISALSDIVVVVEARLHSGTQITVDTALEQGKEVLAVPGRVTDRLSDGCNRLICQGAGVVLDVDDVIERLASWNYRKDSLESSAGFEEERTGECASHIEKAILDQLDAVPVSFSYIADKLSIKGINITVPDLLKELFDMCGKGLITQTGSYYVKKFG